jgi:hypothetical protein
MWLGMRGKMVPQTSPKGGNPEYKNPDLFTGIYLIIPNVKIRKI